MPTIKTPKTPTPPANAGGLPLSQDGIFATCDALGIGAAEIFSVLEVETSGCGFLADRRPKILFERHVFHRLAQGRFAAKQPLICNAVRGGYNQPSNDQHQRLQAAMQLDADAALQSASWGLPQIMGYHFKALGYSSAPAMVADFERSEDVQLAAFANFLKAEGLAPALRNRDWQFFARRYNGPQYHEFHYDQRLAAEYAKKTVLLPDVEVRAAQLMLSYLSFDPGRIDGYWGNRTARALVEFRQAQALRETAALTDTDTAALRRACGFGEA
jgi:hypothetical protein